MIEAFVFDFSAPECLYRARFCAAKQILLGEWIMTQTSRNKKFFTPRVMTRLAVLGALAFLLTFWEVPLPIFPVFLKLDASDIPAVIAAIAFGPLGGVVVQLIKALLDAYKSSTGGIGQLANFIAGTAYVVPLGFVYAWRPRLSGFGLGAVLGTACMVVAACLANYFLIIPLYGFETVLELAQKVNSGITDMQTLILLAFAPFNLLKAGLISILGYLLYKPLQPLLRRI